VGAHVHDCETCYDSFLGRLQKRFPILIDLDELAGLQGWHLEGEELAAYLEGRMDELDFECASLHLEECSSCMDKTSALSNIASSLLDVKTANEYCSGDSVFVREKPGRVVLID
jgi:hypothetical protein